MSQRTHQLAVQLFEKQFQSAYETGSKLRPFVDVKTGVVGLADNFPVWGVADTNERQSTQEVITQNVANSRPQAILRPFESFDLLDKQDRYITNVNALAAMGKPLGKALGRKLDQAILDVLDIPRKPNGDPADAFSTAHDEAYTRPNLVPSDTTYTTVTAGEIDAEDIAECVAILLDEAVIMDRDDVVAIMPAKQYGKFAKDEKMTSADYVPGGRFVKEGTIPKPFGVATVFIDQGARDHGSKAGRLPDNRFYVVAKEAVGLCIGAVETMNVVEWIPMRRSHLVGGENRAGATRKQNAGIVVGTIRS